ncbi:MAG: hypothetical protein K0U93_24925 [Gammaproteobacteria bacterium]|nr:hypothetical protein [Gammaproteobacteria bacterium]
MAPDDYPQTLRELLVGEAFGEAFFETLAAQGRAPASIRLWSLAADVEALTFARLEPLVRQHNADMSAACADAAERARIQAGEFATRSCEDIARYFQGRAIDGLKRFQKIEADGPQGDLPVLRQVTAHSVAFGAFINHWLAGDVDAAAGALQSFLDDTPR